MTENVRTETRTRGSNPSIVRTSDGVVVIDTPQLPTQAVAMRKLAESTGPIRYVMNTEHHCDHIFGNYYFQDVAPVVHHQEIADNFMLLEPTLDPYDFVAESVRTQDAPGLALFPAREAYFADLKRADITFAQDVSLQVGGHTFELLHTPGHTPGQTAVYVPEERVVFTGDTIFSGCQTWLMSSDVGEWLDSLNKIAALDVDYVVPGHGPVTDLSYIRVQRACLIQWVSAVANAVAGGWSREETIARVNPGADLPVDVGLESLRDHISTLNAASLWDKLTSTAVTGI
ncbi:MBL fold metallo-hydrolase [Streptomyces sp. NPDC046821]|uniref:MBL fold metallo-hydrolase n=1 Tax=Streptomyces sp. NPDC046821 TaxID=3154702 RepID=UPI0033C53D7B